MKNKHVNIVALLAAISEISTAKPTVNPADNPGYSDFQTIFKNSLEKRDEAAILAKKEAFETLVSALAPTTLEIQAEKLAKMKALKKSYQVATQELKLYDHALKYAMETGNFFPLLKVGHENLIPYFCEALGLDQSELADDCFLVPEMAIEKE